MTSQPSPLVAADPLVAARQRAHALIAKSSAASVRALFDRMLDLPQSAPLRSAETGLIMVRGRVGGDGQRFNLGELPLTRAAMRIECGPDGAPEGGTVGVGYVAGRDRDHAEMAALADAMVQCDAWREALEDGVLAPLAAELAMRKTANARKAAATKVDFFTMVRTREVK